MEPIEEFEWTLRALRKMFKFNSKDIFQPNYRSGPRFYVILALSSFLVVCYVSTICDLIRNVLCLFASAPVDYCSALFRFISPI